MRLEDLAAKLADLQAQADSIAEAITETKAQILMIADVGDLLSVNGEPLYRVQAGSRRFAEAQARKVLPADIIDAATVTEPRLDSKRLRDLVPPALWDACCTVGAPAIRAVRA